MRQEIKDYWLFPVFALLWASVAYAQPQAPQEYCITITEQKTLDKAAELCPILRSRLPAHKRNPWSGEDCIKQAAILTFKEINREETAIALRLSLRNIDQLDTQVEPTPQPVPTPSPSPAPTPTATPTPTAVP